MPDRPQYYTENYDVTRMLGEITVMNNVLFGIDGGRAAYLLVCPAARCWSAASTTPSALRDPGS